MGAEPKSQAKGSTHESLEPECVPVHRQRGLADAMKVTDSERGGIWVIRGA